MMVERRAGTGLQSGPACSTLGSVLGSPPAGAESVLLPGPAEDRFDFGVEIGAGGMGRVRLVRDGWLGRQIAVKEPATEADARRLWREALITARLEHPGIVPVYDLGLDGEGRPWFAMRVVRGRSLAEILGDSLPARERQDLLRPLLAACEAVGFAHRQGVVHRDLKPANLMVGAFGEMQVIDWGLAQSADLPDGTLGSAGTLYYMSPEQARGEPVNARSDVWSLGAVLYEIVVGARARAGANDIELAAAARRGDAQAIPDETPADLAAILKHALAPEPAARYPDAKALADDLARYLDGRRVRAHSYTPLELLQRLLRAWRVPFLVAGVSLVVLTGLVVAGVGRIQDERDGAERNLAVSLVHDAQRALEEDRLIEAQLLASEALTRAPSSSRLGAEARGVLAAVGATVPTRSERADLPCTPDDVAWRREGARVTCRDRHAIALWDDGVRRWSRAVSATMSRFMEGGDAVLALRGDRLEALDAASGATLWEDHHPCTASFGARWAEGGDGRTVFVWHEHCLARIGASAIDLSPARPCGRAGVTVLAGHRDGRRIAIACNDGSLVELDGAASTRFEAGMGTADHPPMVTALDWVDDDRIVVGAADGSIEQVRLRPTFERKRSASQRGLVRRLSVSDEGGLAIVLADASAPLVLDLVRAASLLRLPDPLVRDAEFDAEGLLGTLVDGRAGYSPSRLERWDLSALLPRRLHFPDGVTTVATSPWRAELAVGDGARLAILGGDRRLVAAHRWQDGIIKSIAFDASGKVVAHAHGSPDIRTFDPVVRRSDYVTPPTIWRRVAVLADQTVVAANFRHDLYLTRRDAFSRWLGRRSTIDLRASSDGRSIVRLVAGGTIECGPAFTETLELFPCGDDPDASAVTLDDQRLLALEPDGVRVWDLEVATGRAESHETRYEAVGAHLLSLATSGDLIAAGAKDGSVWVWRQGVREPLAIVRNHQTRVDSVAFDAAGRWLIAGGWDGYLSFIEPHDLEERRERIRTAFGLALEDVFSVELDTLR